MAVSALLTTISAQVTLYFGFFVLITGLIGGILNIIVFLSLKTFRQNSCAFFLTVMSFVNIGQLLTSLLSRIFITGFNIDWTDSSVVYCKFRYYSLQVCGLTSYTCMCLATIDQFLATSFRSRWQQLFNIRRAQFLCVFVFILWLLHGIPCLIWFSPILSPKTGTITCLNTNAQYQQYFSYFYTLILAGILPLIITVLFGSLAYRNVRQMPYRTIPLVRRELDKQLTSMVLVQVAHNCVVIVPYISVLTVIYLMQLTFQSPNYEEMIFTNLIVGLIHYLYFSSPFYIYICVSRRFRQQLFHVLTRICTGQQQQPGYVGDNQVVPQIQIDFKS